MQHFEIHPLLCVKNRVGEEFRLQKLLLLLGAIHEEGNLARACTKTDISYRHAWGVIQQGNQLFGVQLAQLTRGQGARLTEMGERLVWAEKRARARLTPMLQSIASEFDAEIGRTLHAATSVLRIHASHGYAVVALRDALTKRNVAAELSFRGSVESLASLCRSSCELAGFHVPLGEFQAAAVEHYSKWLRPRAHKLIRLVTRRQGIMVVKGNPKGIASIADLARFGVRFVNRQSGSGTRFLLDLLLKRAGLESWQLDGYDRVEFTHDAVAAYIASGMADAGLGVEAGARRANLDFIPLASERYYLACHNEALATEPIETVIDVLRSADFRAAVGNLQGLDTESSGSIVSMKDAFGDPKP